MEEIDAGDVSGYLAEHEVLDPVRIMRNGQPHAVMIPYEIFQIMHRNNRRAVRTEDLTDEDIEAIINAEVPDELKKYDHEMDD